MRECKFQIGQVVQVLDSITAEPTTGNYFRVNYIAHDGGVWLFASLKSGPWFYESELAPLTEKEKGPVVVPS